MIFLNLESVRSYISSKHNITPAMQEQSIENVANNLVGLHSARLPTPYVTLVSRIAGFTPNDLREELYTLRKLIKIRCMRRTLHILPLEIAPIAHKATLSFRIADCKRQFNSLRIEDGLVEDLKYLLLERLEGAFFSSQEIEEILLSENTLHFSVSNMRMFIKTLIKYLWETGVFCYVNKSDTWYSEKRLYAFTQSFYPTLKLEFESVHEAESQLIYQHINQFGPVSLKDISWWSGLGIVIVRKHLEKMKNDSSVIVIFIENSPIEFYMTSEDYDSFTRHRVNEERWVRLLAYEDSSLKGYFESRWRYVSDEYYKLLFNQIGEVRASIVAQGEIIGIWEWDKKRQKVNTTLFTKSDRVIMQLLQKEIETMERTLQLDIHQKYLL